MRIAILISFGLLGACMKMNPPADYPQKQMATAELEDQCNELYAKTTHGKRMSWKGHIPIEFVFDVDFPKDYIPAVKSAMATWNKAAGFELFHVSDLPRAASLPGRDGINTIYYMQKGPREAALRQAVGANFQQDGGIAETHIFGEANRITDADMIFDGSDNAFTTNLFHVASYDVESTALHELGHVLGLAHNPNPLSTMFYGELSISFSLRILDSTSIKLINCEYP